MRIELSWPPDGCHPNKSMSMNWRDKGKHRKWYKELCNADTRNQVSCPIKVTGMVPVSIVFHPKRNSGDIDNMLAACKSGIDGMCLALGIDDRILRPMTLDVGKKSEFGKVILTIGVPNANN